MGLECIIEWTPEEHVDDEGVDGGLVVDIQDAPEVLDGLGTLLVFEGQHEVQEGLVVYLPLECLVLLEHPVYEDGGESPVVLDQLLFGEQSVVVRVQLDVLLIHPQRRLEREPVGRGLLLLVLLLPQFVQFRQNGTGQHVLDVYPAGPFGVQEEEEFAHCCDHVEGIEVFLEVFQLHEGRDQFEDVVFQVFLS